ncbi:CHAT domain-containing protein [Desulfococcaceae bacterium HSG9]|nr:CHAT domain-containing protein [Desulfococcaceae bacterium HSG9]
MAIAQLAEFLRKMLGTTGNSENKNPDKTEMNRLIEAGKKAFDAAEYDKAQALWKQGLTIARKTGNQKRIGYLLASIGLALGCDDEALTYYEQALAIHKEIGDRSVVGANLIGIGSVCQQLGRYDEALTYYEQALAIHKEIGNRRGQGTNLTNIGAVYAYLDRYDEALTYSEQALAIHKEIGDRRGVGRNLGNIGVVYRSLGRYDEALTYHKQALAIHKEIGDRHGEGVDFSNIGGAYTYLGRYEEALTYLEQALAIKKKIGDRRGEGMVFRNIGGAYTYLGRYEEALTYQEQALAIDKEIGNRHGEGADLTNIGGVYRNLGRYDEALTYHERSLAIRKEIGDRHGEGVVISNIGNVYANLGRNDEALTYYEQALAIRKEIGDRHGEGMAISNIGNVYANLGRNDEALTYYEQALAIKKKIGDRGGDSMVISNIGNVYANLGQDDKALTFYEQALAIAKEIGYRNGEGTSLIGIGTVYIKQGQYDKARLSFAGSLKISETVGAPETLWRAQGGLAGTEAKAQMYDAAIQHFKQALDTIEQMRAGISAKETQISFMQDKLFVYDWLIVLLQSLHLKNPDKGYDRQSLEIFERKQGRILLEETGKSRARNYAGIPDKIVTEENRLADQIAKLRDDLVAERSKPQKNINSKRIRELEDRLKERLTEERRLQERIKKEYPDYYALKYPKPAPLKEIQTKVLKPGEMMLVYGVMEEQTSLWVIGPGQFALHTIDAGTEELKQKVTQYRRLVINIEERDKDGKAIDREKDKTEAEIANLYALLFPDAVQKALVQAETIYIIPTGPLYLLPFEALQTKSPEGKAKPRYLIEDHAVAYLSSASLLKIIRDAQARKKHQPEYPLLAWADPVYKKTSAAAEKRGTQERSESFSEMRAMTLRDVTGTGFERLKETADEVREISEILKAPEKSGPLFLRKDASRSNVFKLNKSEKLDDYRYVVFACHARIPDLVNQISQPSLILSHPDPQTQGEGFLTMADVFGLQFNADLITLSACNTGRGKVIKGEGVIGLTRAFMYAGTPAVAVTLWSVESMSAKELNVGMFKHLNAGKNRAEALRAIKLDMIRGKYAAMWRKPQFWAPLVVFGDAGNNAQ